MSTDTPDVDSEIDALYQAPLKDFVSLRNALVRRLADAGAADASKIVKSLSKPSASAWAVNQLYWQHRERFDAVVEAGDRHRAALAEGDADAAERDRRGAVHEAEICVLDLVEQSGQKATDLLMRRVATTLDAVASYGSANDTPVRGRLTADLDPPGFGAFGALRPPAAEESSPEPVDVVAEREAALEKSKAELTAANERVKHLKEELNVLRERLTDATERAEKAAARVAEHEVLLDEARLRAES